MMTDHFGSFAWPSSQILQSLLLSNRDLVQGKTVLELGCGIGIDGIFASKWAKWVYLTDLGEPSSILENCRRNCEKNHCENVTILPLKWGTFTKAVLNLPTIDILIGSDVCYDTHLLDDLFCTISFFLQRNSNLKVLIVIPERLSITSVQRVESLWNTHFAFEPLEDSTYYVMHNLSLSFVVFSNKHANYLPKIDVRRSTQYRF